MKYNIRTTFKPFVLSRRFNFPFRFKLNKVTSKSFFDKNFAKLYAFLPPPAFTGGVKDEQNKILFMFFDSANYLLYDIQDVTLILKVPKYWNKDITNSFLHIFGIVQ